MDFKEYQEIIRIEGKRLEKYFPIPDKEKSIFAQIVKISEEQGELSEAILSHFSLQRKDKNQTGKEEIANEIADVTICVSLLANQLDINLEDCLKKKLEKIKQREY